MKYRRSLICVGMAMACMSSAYADTLAKVAERNQITLAYRESSIPFSYLDGGKPTGMVVEPLQRLSKEPRANRI